MSVCATRMLISSADHQTLEGWTRGWTTPQRLNLRARILLQAADGLPNFAIAA